MGCTHDENDDGWEHDDGNDKVQMRVDEKVMQDVMLGI